LCCIPLAVAFIAFILEIRTARNQRINKKLQEVDQLKSLVSEQSKIIKDQQEVITDFCKFGKNFNEEPKENETTSTTLAEVHAIIE